MQNGTKFTMVLGMLAALAWLPARADAQQFGTDERSKFEIDARGGVSIPVSDLGDIADPGASFGLGATYWFHERIGARINGDAALLTGLDADETGTGVESPDLDVYRYTGNVVGRITRPESRWNVTANLGAGGVTYGSDDFEQGPIVGPEGEFQEDFSETYFSTTGGVKVGYDLTERIGVFVGGQAYLDFADEEDTAIFNQVAPAQLEDPEGFDTAWTIPVQAGVKIKF